MNRTIAPLLLALAAAPAWAAPRPDTYVELIDVEVDSLDPAWSENMAPLFNIYEPLIGYKGSGLGLEDLQPLLATQVPSRENGLISKDGLAYRFPIREGVRFHDGAPLTPEDVRYSLLRFMLLDSDVGPSAALLEPVTGLKSTRKDGKIVEDAYERAARAVTVDKNEVVVRLHKPFAPILPILANFGRVISKAWCAAQGQWDGRPETWKKFNNLARRDALPNDKADGTGPFRLERYDRENHQLVFVRNDGYWRTPARLLRVYLRTVPDFLTRRLTLEAGDADSIWVSPFNVGQIKGMPGVTVVPGLRKVQSPKLLYFGLRTDARERPYTGSGKLDGKGIPPDFFADKDLRLGFAHVVDYDAMARDIYRGQAARAGSLFAPGLLGYRAQAPLRAFDLKKAGEYFRKAWGGRVWKEGFVFTAPVVPAREEEQAFFSMLKKNLAAVNPRFRLEVRQAQWATLAPQQAKNQVPLRLGGWVNDYSDSHDTAFALLHSAGRLGSAYGIATPEMDRLIEEAAAAQDPRRREQLYRLIDEKVAEDLPFLLLLQPSHNRVQRSWVKGYVHHAGTHGMPYMSYFYDLSKAD